MCSANRTEVYRRVVCRWHVGNGHRAINAGVSSQKSAPVSQTGTAQKSATMRPRSLCLSVGIFWCVSRAVSEYSSKSDLEYEFGDYRGKWCIDDHGFVYGIGEVYYPSPSACPCTCTEDGPLCIRPKCPRIHPRCTRIKYKSCCPVCEAVSKVCIYGGKTYRPLEEFKVRRCTCNTFL